MKTLRVTLADIIGPTGVTGESTATVHARYVDTSGRGRDVHLTDGTIVVPVRREDTPSGSPQVFDFDVYANDVAPVREVDYGHLVEVSWTVVAPTGAKTSGVRRVQITDSMASVVQLGLLSTPTPVPPYTGGYVLPDELDALDARVVVLEAGGGGGGVTDHGALTGLADDDHTQYALADGTRGTFAAPLGADDNYVTDAEKTKLANLSGTNTGDQTLPTWTTIAGKPAVVAAGATQADARTAISAGTSSFSGAYADLTSKPTLGDAAAKNTGTTAGTVAAGDDSRIGKIGGTVTVTGTPTAGQVPVASSDTAAAWGTVSGAAAEPVSTITAPNAWTLSPYSHGTGTTPQNPSINLVHLLPARFARATTISALAVYRSAAASAGAVDRLGVFRDNGSERPGVVVAQTTMAADTTGTKQWTLSPNISFAAGELFWVGHVVQGGASGGTVWHVVAKNELFLPNGAPGAAAHDQGNTVPVITSLAGAFTDNPTVGWLVNYSDIPRAIMKVV